MMATPTIRWLAIGLSMVGLALLVYVLGVNPPAQAPRLGARGLKRKQALAEGGLFKLFEPVIRFVAGWSARVPFGDQRRKVDQLIVQSGEHLGLTPDEFFAMSFLSGVAFLLFGTYVNSLANLGALIVIALMMLGVFLPYVTITGRVQRRFVEVNRALPTAVDLMALCMSAGLDFPGALRQIIEKSSRPQDALHEEMLRIQQELELGHTRRQALEHFAERVPTDSVRDFVGAVVQAEEKGNPLAEVLQIQAGMQRMRRSVMAEESAAKAGVKMMLPLMLIFASIITILLGPFIVNSMQTGW